MQTSLRSDFAWTLAGNVANGASQWAILSLIAKLASTEALGEYALGVAVAMPLAMLAHLNLRAVLATDLAGAHPFADYLAVRIVASLAAIAAISIVALSGYSISVALSIVLIGLSINAESFSDLYYGYMQRDRRMHLIGRSMMLRAAVSIAAVAVAAYFFRSAVAVACALVLSRLLVLVFYDRPRSEATPGRVAQPWSVLRTALPLGLALMLIALNTNVPRYVVEHRLGIAELGAFAAVASFVTVGSTMVNALGQSAMTHLAERHATGDRAGFRKLSAQMVLLALMLGGLGALVAAIAGPLVLQVVYRPEFRVYAPLLVDVMLASILIYAAVMLGYVLTSTRRFAEQIPLLLSVAAASAATSYFAVPALGLRGAALALAVGGLVQIGGELILLARLP